MNHAQLPNATAKLLLRCLADGKTASQACGEAGLSQELFASWLQGYLQGTVPSYEGTLIADTSAPVEIIRDRYGIPHIFAESEPELCYGLGFAMGQDRLWQMDYLRRAAYGRLCEVFGRSKLELDLVARTVGINRIALQEEQRLTPQVRAVLEAFSAGINRVMEESQDNFPVEFDLLDYEPEPWRPADTLAVLRHFWWQLSGRLFQIVGPELVKRELANDTFYEAFLKPESHGETIVPPGYYPAKPAEPEHPTGEVLTLPDDGTGSNNWVVAPKKSQTGSPLLASDPHVPLTIPSTCYIAHVCGGGYDAIGYTYPGSPGIRFGRNEHLAWGVTNNICSLRDLYLEQINPDHPDHYLYDGKWVKMRSLVEEIQIKGESPFKLELKFTPNGPVVNHILPKLAQRDTPISLRWVGAEHCDDVGTILASNRARTIDEFTEALREWRAPTLNMVIADVEGNIAYQCIGRIPIRTIPERGYRPGWDPRHQWQGYVPYEGAPAFNNPERGWIATANNQTAPDDFPYPLSGTWPADHRARRIRDLLTAKETFSVEDFRLMQIDWLSLRAAETCPHLVAFLSQRSDARTLQALQYLKEWDYRYTSESVAASIFEVFWIHWRDRVLKERLSEDLIEYLDVTQGALLTSLLQSDAVGWFKQDTGREEAIGWAFAQTLELLTQHLGEDMVNWTWGSIHTVTLGHVLSDRAGLKDWLNTPRRRVGGTSITVGNNTSGSSYPYTTTVSANYRQVVDLNTRAIWLINSSGQSGHPGSPHYHDHFDDWVEGCLYRVSMERQEIAARAEAILKLMPAARSGEARP